MSLNSSEAANRSEPWTVFAGVVRWAVLCCLLFVARPGPAATGGSISGVVKDASGAAIADAQVTLIGDIQHATFKVTTDRRGAYSFPNLPVGTYVLRVEMTSFARQERRNLQVDTGAALRTDVQLLPGTSVLSVTVVSDSSVEVEKASTDLGQVVKGRQMTALPLNGRSYTDLLAAQPGVAPVTTLLPSSVIMAGVTGAINPSGDLNAGNLSINGQRESANGFQVNGIDVQEHMNGGTSIVPNLDAIDELRVLTTNFDPEYGNYNGGTIVVVTRQGSDRFHGSGFEFFRNTALDARGYFDPERSAFSQNQFGGTAGGPVRRGSVFFFSDYQGTRSTEGVSTGNISVPTLAQRSGIFADVNGHSTLAGTAVSGPFLASLLSQKLGRTITAGQAYADVFPGGVIPQSAWSGPGRNLLQYIPSPNVGTGNFASSAFQKVVRDDKGSLRMDVNTRMGIFSGYGFVDDYRLNNPYPGSVAGASVPGFDADTIGRAQMYSLQHAKTIGTRMVNEAHLGIIRNANVIGQPSGGTNVTLAQQGFASGLNGGPGIAVQAPQFEGVENITFPSFVMGVPVTNMTQWNNSLYASESFTVALGQHIAKVGAQFHLDQVNTHPNGTFNGTFSFNGTETGSPYADFLIGTPSNFTQSAGPPFYLRNHYLGVYAQDSWRAREDLTVNLGVRWDLISPWTEKFNRLQTYVPGSQSVLYPGAPRGLVVPGDPGIPNTIAPTQYGSVAPRLGVAWAPSFSSGLLKTIFGANGQSSIRASFGLFYSAFPGLNAGIMYAVPPFGYNYLSPAPPLFDRPFITAASGLDNGQRFPVTLPPTSVSAKNPDTAINWGNYTPLSADPFFDHNSRVAYSESYMLSIQRQLSPAMLMSISFAGNQGHHQMALVSVNPGDPARCLSLPGCGPFGEDGTYADVNGNTVQGTRVGQGPLYGENTSDNSIANSNYNSLQSTLRYSKGASQFLLSYAFSKSIDQASNLGEQLDPTDLRHTRAISAWDQKHSFVATYTVELPIASLLHSRKNRLTDGWSVSGASRFASGLPVTLFDTSDNSLLGTLGNGANNYLLDTPRFTPGKLRINTDGRNGRPAFNTALFAEEALGELGNSKRRMFYGPGIDNFDVTVAKTVPFTEGRSLMVRVEAFNVFNQAQFFGPAAVEGHISEPSFGHVIQADAPRLMQIVAKFSF